jgi:ribosomal protein S27AE
MGDVLTKKQWRISNPEKAYAHYVVSNAIRYGKLVKNACEVCGASKVDAHHNDYTKPLEVVWLCHKCHYNEDKVKHSGPPPYKYAFSEDEMKKAELLRKEGCTYKSIAETLKRSKSAVFKHLNSVEYK